MAKPFQHHWMYRDEAWRMEEMKKMNQELLNLGRGMWRFESFNLRQPHLLSSMCLPQINWLLHALQLQYPTTIISPLPIEVYFGFNRIFTIYCFNALQYRYLYIIVMLLFLYTNVKFHCNLRCPTTIVAWFFKETMKRVQELTHFGGFNAYKFEY